MELVKDIKSVLRDMNDYGSEEKWQSRLNRLVKEMQEIDDAAIVRSALGEDDSDVLPFQLKKSMYQRLIELDRSPDNLREYAWWLQLNGGPNWDDEANDLLEEAERM